jgi:hypothetical protein
MWSMGDSIYAYDLLRIVRNPDYYGPELEAGIARTRFYERFADVGKHVVRVIHALPKMWDDSALDSIEVYIGRAAATAKHIKARWEEHLDHKSHEHGAIVLRCSTDVVSHWETAAVRAIKGLESRGRLCVRNAIASGHGALPSTKESVIYITWKTGGRARQINLADKRMVDEVARDVAEHTTRLGINVDSMRRALDPITRPVHERADMEWHPAHSVDED